MTETTEMLDRLEQQAATIARLKKTLEARVTRAHERAAQRKYRRIQREWEWTYHSRVPTIGAYTGLPLPRLQILVETSARSFSGAQGRDQYALVRRPYENLRTGQPAEVVPLGESRGSQSAQTLFAAILAARRASPLWLPDSPWGETPMIPMGHRLHMDAGFDAYQLGLPLIGIWHAEDEEEEEYTWFERLLPIPEAAARRRCEWLKVEKEKSE